LEYSLFEAYNKDSQDLFSSDIATFDFLRELREGQTESIIEYSDLLNAAELVNIENNFEVLYFEQTYF
jgi:ferritin